MWKASFPTSVPAVERSLEQVEFVPEPEAFSRAVDLMTAYVRREEGAYARLIDAAHDDPESMTQSLIALGAVLLDIAAGAFKLTPDEMLGKVSVGIKESVSG
jgi:hypothetical protein